MKTKTATSAQRANAFNPYKIYWMALVPVKGKPTKTDMEKLNKIVGKKYFGNMTVSFTAHFPTKEKAIAALKLIKKADIKQYKAYLFTDKQFGMADKNGNLPITTTSAVKLTDKQMKSAVLIGNAPAKKTVLTPKTEFIRTNDATKVLKQKVTKNGWTIKLLQTGKTYMVVSSHDSKRGYGTRYAGNSKETAIKAFNR